MENASSLCVFCGSKFGEQPAFRAAAAELGRLMAERGVGLVYGGGRIGLMGVVAEAVLAGGGQVTGIIPEFLQRLEVGNDDVQELIVTDSMHSRKRRMFERSDAFVALPGGLGTFDETIEILTWKQLRLHDKPIVLINTEGYWDTFRQLVIQAIGNGFAHPAVSELFTIVDDPAGVFDAIAAAPEPKEETLTSHL